MPAMIIQFLNTGCTRAWGLDCTQTVTTWHMRKRHRFEPELEGGGCLSRAVELNKPMLDLQVIPSLAGLPHPIRE